MANKYYIEMSVNFQGEIVADSEAQAEELAWTAWGDTADADVRYDCVNSIKVEYVGKDDCEDCDELGQTCECEEEEA